MLARLNQTIRTVTDGLDKYDAYNASLAIDEFVDDLSLWYIRRSRNRVGPAAESETDKVAFYQTTYYILHTTAKLLAPFTPFLSEIIYRNLTKEESVHLTNWPEAEILNDEDIKILREMKTVREIVEKGHSLRKEKKLPVRQPLNSFSTTRESVSKNLEYLIKDEINVKRIIWNSKTDKFDTKITPELEEEAKVRELARQIQEERKTMGINLAQKINVANPWLPADKNLTDWLKKKAQIEKLTVGEFKVQNV